MAAFSKRLKGAMSSYFDAGKDNRENGSVFLTEVPNGTTDLVAEDPTSRHKKKGLEVCSTTA